jgi:hypothetical protein
MVIGGATAPDYFFFILSRRSFFYLSQKAFFLSLADLADFADILIYKNHKNPFVLVETTSLMPCLYAWSFERGSMPKPTATPSIPTGFQPGQKKNPGSSNLKKQAAPICEIRAICER